MRILGPVVEPLMATMLDTWHHLALGRPVARQLVGDHHPRHPSLPLQQLAQQALGRLLGAPALHQHVEHEAGLINSPPQPGLHPSDRDDDLIEVPFVASAGEPAPDRVGERLAELARPLPYGLAADGKAAPPASPRPCASSAGSGSRARRRG
jgi:hypothetical protein